MEQKLRRFWEQNKTVFVWCMAAVMIWGLAAHAYQFLNFQLSHDSLDGLNAAGAENAHKIELGRIFAPAYRYVLRGMFAMPWLTGFLALCWIGLAAFMAAKLFDIQSKVQLVLLCGVMTVNLTVTALTATYLHDLDINMFGMMLNCLAVLVWKKRSKGWFLIGAAAVAVSMGMYQSYVSVTITLVMMSLVLQLADGEKAGKAFRRGVSAALMTLAGGALYYAGLQLVTQASGVALAQRSNSVTQLANLQLSRLPELIGGLYLDWWDYFAVPHTTWLTPEVTVCIHAALGALLVAALVWLLVRRDLGAAEKLLAAVMVLLLPLGMNVCYILTSGGAHDLMKYAFVLIYVLCLLLTARMPRRIMKWACGALACMLLWGNVQTSNSIYLKKTAMWNATYSAMNNVVYDMLYYGYVPDETEVFVYGAIPIGSYPGFEAVEDVTGVGHNNSVTDDQKSIRSYFQYVLGDRMLFASEEQQQAIMATEDFEWMSRWPDEGYITVIEDVLVVKLN